MKSFFFLSLFSWRHVPFKIQFRDWYDFRRLFSPSRLFSALSSQLSLGWMRICMVCMYLPKRWWHIASCASVAAYIPTLNGEETFLMVKGVGIDRITMVHNVSSSMIVEQARTHTYTHRAKPHSNGIFICCQCKQIQFLSFLRAPPVAVWMPFGYK